MGMSFGKTCYGMGGRSLPASNRAANPNPLKFNIEKYELIGNFLLTQINYPDCLNFEGRKVILFRNMSLSELQQLGCLDPHFSANGKIIARFIPTDDGWKLGRIAAALG